MSEEFPNFECGSCGEPIAPPESEQEWCGNTDCHEGPDAKNTQRPPVDERVEPVPPKDAPSGMESHDELPEQDVVDEDVLE